MYALVLALLLSAGGSGASHRPGTIRRPTVIGPFAVAGGLLAGSAAVQWRAPDAVTLESIQWTEATAGVGTSMTYSVAVDATPVCSVVVACDSTGLVSQDCAAAIPAGGIVSVMVRIDNCLVGNPSGSLMLVVR